MKLLIGCCIGLACGFVLGVWTVADVLVQRDARTHTVVLYCRDETPAQQRSGVWRHVQVLVPEVP